MELRNRKKKSNLGVSYRKERNRNLKEMAFIGTCVVHASFHEQ